MKSARINHLNDQGRAAVEVIGPNCDLPGREAAAERFVHELSRLAVYRFLLFANGFFVAAEFALVKVRISQIDQLVEEGSRVAQLTSKALDRLDAYLSASQLGITVASLALGNAIHDKIEPAIIEFFGWMGWRRGHGFARCWPRLIPFLALSLVTFLHMALGEQAPKSLAIRYPEARGAGDRADPGGVHVRVLADHLAPELGEQPDALDAGAGDDRPRRADAYGGRAAAHSGRKLGGRRTLCRAASGS